jgi:hypothetical protein
MKLLQWLFEDITSEVHVRAEYARTPDKELVGINPSHLTAIGLKCYREEMKHRKLIRPQTNRAKK